MQEDLDKERKVIMKQWAKRQEQTGRDGGDVWALAGYCGAGTVGAGDEAVMIKNTMKSGEPNES